MESPADQPLTTQEPDAEPPVAEPGQAESARTGSTLWLARQLLALPETGLRVRRLAGLLRDGEPAEVLPQLEAAVRRGLIQTHLPYGSPGARELHLALVTWLLLARPRPQFPVGTWPQADDGLTLSVFRVATLLREAKVLDLPYLSLLLREGFRIPAATEDRLLQLHPSVDKLPLGTRRERARLTDRNQLQFLLLDSTPAVVQLLAENPRVVEAHAVQIASMRPTHPWALQALLSVPRWLGNERVVEAAARNTSAPGWLVLALAPLLPLRIRQALVHLTWLGAEVRDLLAQWQSIVPNQQRRDAEPQTVHVDAAALELAMNELDVSQHDVQVLSEDDEAFLPDDVDPELAAALAEALADPS